MSTVSIPTLLARLGLSRYESSFLENGITEDLFLSLGHEELKELGVAGLGDRMQILAAVARLVPANALDPLVDRWPSVLAIPLQEYLAEENPVLKLWLACDVVEMLLRFIVMAGVAEVRTEEGLPNKLVRELRDRIEHPTLGKWQGMARAVVREVEPDRAVVPELRSYLEKVLVPLLDGTIAPATAESSFSRLRNTLAHGGGLTKSVARRLLGIWRGRFEEAIEKGTFLGELSLRVRDASGPWGELRGTTTVPVAVDAEPDLPSTRDAESKGRLSLVRARRILDLWPLAWYGEPLAEDLSKSGFGDSPQVFVRRGEVRLEYTPVGSTGAARSVGEDGTLSAFLRFFLPEDRVARAEAREFVVRGFEGDFCKDADRLVGRAREADALREAVDAANRSVIWVSGQAGVGKSYVVAKVAADLLAEAPAGTLVLPYRFRAGDDRCGRDPFVRYCVERLEAWLGDVCLPAEADEAARTQEKPLERLEKLLERALARGRIVFVLDGLDEIAERDSTFAEEVPLSLRHRGGIWLCAGRPERGLPEAFEKAQTQRPFPEGLPPMSEMGIREMLLEKFGPLRKKLLRGDREAGERILNPFVDRVAKLSEGLPIYVKYVVGDVLSGKISPDESARLPPSLARYHEELLDRYAVGDLHAIATPLAGTLAVAREPLTTEELVALLARRGLVTGDGGSLALVGRCLSAIASMVRLAPDPDGGDGYTLWHHSLRQHILESPETRETVATASRAMADGGLKPAGDAAARYLYRQGISHLLAEGRRDEALELMTDGGYLKDRIDTLQGGEALERLAEDWEAWLLRVLDPGDREETARQFGAKLDTLCQRSLSDGDGGWRRQLTRLLLFELGPRLEVRLGATNAYRRVAAITNRLICGNLNLEPGDREHLEHLAISYGDLGRLAERSNHSEARALFLKALAIDERLAAADPENAKRQWGLSVSFDSLGALDARHDAHIARRWFQKALEIRKRLWEREPENTLYLDGVAISYQHMGGLEEPENPIRARRWYRKELLLRKQLASRESDNPDFQRDLSVVCGRLSNLDKKTNPKRALQALEEGRAVAERVLANEPENPTFLRDLAIWHMRMGELVERDDPPNAREWYVKSLGGQERLVAWEPENRTYMEDLLSLYRRLAELDEGVESEKTREWYGKALSIAERLVGLEPESSGYLWDLSVLYDNMGGLDERRFPEKAREWYRKALATVERLIDLEGREDEYLLVQAILCSNLGDLDRRSAPVEARRWYQKSLSLRQRHIKSGRPDPDLPTVYFDLAECDERLGGGSACELYEQAIALQREIATNQPDEADGWLRLADALHRRGLIAIRSGAAQEAVTLDKECVAALECAEGSAPERYDHYYQRGCFEATRGRSERALEALRRAVALGFSDTAEMNDDDELISLRANPGFVALLKEIETKTKPADAGEKGTG